MAIPDFQTLMLPLLQFAADDEEHTIKQATAFLADRFELSPEERSQLLPSGQQAVFENRVGWARTYMGKAGLIENTKRPFFRITKRGLDTLSSQPSAINTTTLEQYPEFREFRARSEKTVPAPKPVLGPAEQTPYESLEYGYHRLREDLADELLTKVRTAPSGFFERLVVQLLLKMGYGGATRDAGRAIGRSGDEGIDGIINEDALGLEVIYIQAKRWTGSVGRPEVQKFVGALHGQQAQKGVFITTGSYTPEAKQYAANIPTRVVLVDGDLLAQLMIDHDIGVSSVSRYEIKRVDSDYFTEA
jgi:restriction system protein